MDTRTPRTPPGGTTPGFDDEPSLNMVKVASDPAQIIVNYASFRVQLGGPAPRSSALTDTAMAVAARPAGAAGVAGATGVRRRRAPVVWTGRTGPEDTGATRLLQAARTTTTAGRPAGEAGRYPGHYPERDPEPGAAATTQVLPRVGQEAAPTVVGPRGPRPPETTQPLLAGVRPTRGAYDEGGRYGDDGYGPGAYGDDADDGYHDRYDERHPDSRGRSGQARRRGDPVRHAYYPGRRMNLGVVLLPLRIFLGFISVYAGMGKLCDPVYFNGGDRGSMVTWLQSLQPWAVASPLRDFALAHPVGAGLTVAFLQIIVGVLTMCGLWQRLAASFGALLSAALILTVSWRTVPAYDAPDIIYLAAWSPLIIAGAPVYSVDARLAGEAWRRLGPRVGLWDLRRRVLRRGSLLATLVAGLALLIGATLGGAVRSSQTVTVPEHEDERPTNNLPGSALPSEPGGREARSSAGPGSGERETERSASPSAPQSGSPSARQGDAATPSQGQTAPAQPQPPQPPPVPETPTSAGSASGATTTGGGSTSAGGGSSGGDAGDGSSSGGSDGGALGGLLG